MPSRPSAHASTISFVASAPVGDPFAMLTLGEAARSFRAPAIPSSTQRPMTGSMWKHGSTTSSNGVAFVQLLPPSVDVNMTCWLCVGSENGGANRSPKMYAVPVESVRTVQPEMPKPLALLLFGSVPAGASCFESQVDPPSPESRTVNGTGAFAFWWLPFERNCA